MSNLSPNNRIINSINRSRYIDKLKANIGILKFNKTPIHHKLMDKYEDLTSNIKSKYVITFVSILVITTILLYYFKPKFILINNNKVIEENKLKISSNKQKENKTNEKIISYWKLLLYSFIITIIIYSVLYFMRNKVSYIGKIFL